MAVGINMPQKPKSNGLSSLMSLAGAGLGALAGGPSGAALGMGLGGQLGAMTSKPESGPAPVATGGDAMSRRLQSLNDNPLKQIRDSIDSLKYVQDDQQRAELAKPLMQADYMARMKGVGSGSVG